ncbi:MAG: DNA recombination protein RmuC [Desulfovibrio sp.]|nr:DNA recombination protein RmuC [Desulfovibrio sp.]
MFVPIDGALSSALEAAPSLYDEAQREGVYLVSPSTLLPALRVAASLWMLARQNERVQAIAASAGKVHDRLAAVLGALADADKRRQALNASFDTLSSRLQHGSRSLAAMLEAFSAKASLEQVKAALASDAGALAESRSEAQASGEAACQTQSTREAPALGAAAMHDGQAMHTGQGVQSGQPVQAAQALRALREGPAGEALRQSSAKQVSLLAATAIRRDAPRTPATQQPSSHQNSAHQLSASLQAPYDDRFPVWDECFDQAPLPAGDAEGMREPERDQDSTFPQGPPISQRSQSGQESQNSQKRQYSQSSQSRHARTPERVSEFVLPGESEENFWQTFPKAGNR